MQRDRRKWRPDPGARALRNVADIRASIVALEDEDLLDLHDIFNGTARTIIGEMATEEMLKRNLKP